MSKKLTDWQLAEKRLRKKVFTGKELSPQQELFREVFIENFSKKYIKSNKINIGLHWNIKLSDLIDSMNIELSLNKLDYINSFEFIKDIFKFYSFIEKNDKYIWISTKTTKIFKEVIFSKEDNKIKNKFFLFKSKRIEIILLVKERKIILNEIKNNKIDKSFTKSFEIRDLDIYPSERGVMETVLLSNKIL